MTVHRMNRALEPPQVCTPNQARMSAVAGWETSSEDEELSDKPQARKRRVRPTPRDKISTLGEQEVLLDEQSKRFFLCRT
jgi:hypothetical protein